MQKHQVSFNVEDPSSRENDACCAFFAKLAYEAQAQIETELAEHGYGGAEVVLLQSHLTSCLIVRRDRVTVIAFKGTTTWREWLNNANVWLEPTPYGRIHAGFLHTIRQFGPRLHLAIIPDLISGSKIVLTGHSRGGPLSYLFAFYLALQGHKALLQVAFGSPKYCDKEFACFCQGIPYVPKARPPASPFMTMLIWLNGFKTIFIITTLYRTIRFLWPHIASIVMGRFLHLKLISWFVVLVGGQRRKTSSRVTKR